MGVEISCCEHMSESYAEFGAYLKSYCLAFQVYASNNWVDV